MKFTNANMLTLTSDDQKAVDSHIEVALRVAYMFSAFFDKSFFVLGLTSLSTHLQDGICL